MSTPQPEHMLTPAQAAASIGPPLDADRVRTLIHRGELRAYNLTVGRKRPRWYIKVEDLETWLESRRSDRPRTASRRRARRRASSTEARQYLTAALDTPRRPRKK